MYLNVLTAYGIAGLLPLSAAITWRLTHRTSALKPERAMAVVLVVAMASFVNDPLVWYGLVFALPFNVVLPQRAVQAQVVAWSAIVTDARERYATGAAIGIIMFGTLGAWAAQRDAWVASAELEIGRTGAYRLEAVEASGDAEDLFNQSFFDIRPRFAIGVAFADWSIGRL